MRQSAGQPKPTHADAYQGVPRPVGAMAHDLPPAFEIPWHSHPRYQLIFAVRGVMLIDTREATWLVPPQRAVWMPPKTAHRVRTSTAVGMRTLYIRPAAVKRMPKTCEVFEVTPLLRELILRATELPMEYDERGPAGRVMRLLRALGWIAEGRPIVEVALELGYESPSAFSAMFRRELGVPPSHFRGPAA